MVPQQASAFSHLSEDPLMVKRMRDLAKKSRIGMDQGLEDLYRDQAMAQALGQAKLGE